MLNQRGKDMLAGAIVGTVLGAATALLLAPKSGRELRADIAEGCQQISGKTQQFAASVTEKTQKMAKQVGTHTSEWLDKAKDTTTQVVGHIRARKTGSSDENEATAEAEETIELTGTVAD